MQAYTCASARWILLDKKQGSVKEEDINPVLLVCGRACGGVAGTSMMYYQFEQIIHVVFAQKNSGLTFSKTMKLKF
jgi:hypothetical protein